MNLHYVGTLDVTQNTQAANSLQIADRTGRNCLLKLIFFVNLSKGDFTV